MFSISLNRSKFRLYLKVNILYNKKKKSIDCVNCLNRIQSNLKYIGKTRTYKCIDIFF